MMLAAPRIEQRLSMVELALLALGLLAGAATAHAQGLLSPQPRAAAETAPLILVQNVNPSVPFTVPQMPEPPVSPINPGTLPGSTSAVGGAATGSNPITGLPCDGSGSIAVSGAGGLPGTATAPVGTSETLDQIPVGAPPVTSIFGSQSNLGSC